jgi:hypothetical protein
MDLDWIIDEKRVQLLITKSYSELENEYFFGNDLEGQLMTLIVHVLWIATERHEQLISTVGNYSTLERHRPRMDDDIRVRFVEMGGGNGYWFPFAAGMA